MQVSLTKSFTFEAAHFLPSFPEGHKCRRMHGHSFHVTIFMDGPTVHPENWVIDYADITKAWQPLHELLDHRTLNDIPMLGNPTVEELARWIWYHLALPKGAFSGELQLTEIQIRETCTAGVIYKGENYD